MTSFDAAAWQCSCLFHGSRYMFDSITRRVDSPSTKGVLPWCVNDAVDLKCMIISTVPRTTLRGNVWVPGALIAERSATFNPSNPVNRVPGEARINQEGDKQPSRGDDRDHWQHARMPVARCHSPSSPSCAWWCGDGTRRLKRLALSSHEHKLSRPDVCRISLRRQCDLRRNGRPLERPLAPTPMHGMVSLICDKIRRAMWRCLMKQLPSTVLARSSTDKASLRAVLPG
jgi:hypothetical protein